MASFLSVADGVLIGVMPPAGDFSRGRKVTKSPLRTKVLRTPFGLLWEVCPVILAAFAADGCKGGRSSPLPALEARSLGGGRGLCNYTAPKPSPLGGRCLRRRRMRGTQGQRLPFTVILHCAVPHPALRATFPRWGKALDESTTVNPPHERAEARHRSRR